MALLEAHCQVLKGECSDLVTAAARRLGVGWELSSLSKTPTCVSLGRFNFEKKLVSGSISLACLGNR